jgi:hypothetical protein
MVCAMIDGAKYPEGGVAGYGATLPDALRELAKEIEREVGYDVDEPVRQEQFLAGKKAGMLQVAQMLLDCATLAHRFTGMDLSKESMLYTWRYQDVVKMISSIYSGGEPSKNYPIAESGICHCGEMMEGHSTYSSNHAPTDQTIILTPDLPKYTTDVTADDLFLDDSI